jgi:hypothetical protein
MGKIKIMAKEQSIHKQVCTYLKMQFPKAIYHTDFAAGVKMSIGQAVKNASLQSGKSWPDLFIAEPRNGHFGLFIEIKASMDKVYKKDLTFKKDEHVQAQAEMLTALTERGYKSVFGCGFDHCKTIIDEYMKTK